MATQSTIEWTEQTWNPTTGKANERVFMGRVWDEYPQCRAAASTSAHPIQQHIRDFQCALALPRYIEATRNAKRGCASHLISLL